MKEPSYMIVIPMSEEELADPRNFMERLTQNGIVKVNNMNFEDDRGMVIDLEVEGISYQIALNPVDVEIPGFVRPEHAFSEEEIKLIDEARAGLSICMDFEGDSNRCFYDQLRIIDILFPKCLAVLDCP